MMFPDYINTTNLKRIDAWLFGIGVGLALNHLVLAWKVDGTQMVASSLLYWVAACLLIWRKRHVLSLTSKSISTTIGLFLIGFILFRTTGISEHNLFLRVCPLISLFAWSLLASGISGIRQYLKEFLILSWSILDGNFLANTLNISVLTAKLSGYSLWYLGFPVTLEGANIILPTGSVEVNPGCSGYTIILQLLGLAIIFVSLFPTPKVRSLILLASAIGMGFLINIFRVSLMAVLVAANQKEAFLYWHEEDGSLIFSVIGVLCFSLFYNFLNRNDELEDMEVED